MDTEMIVADFVAKMREYGVIVQPHYTLNQWGDIISITFDVVGRCN